MVLLRCGLIVGSQGITKNIPMTVSSESLAPIQSGMTWPYRSAYQGFAVSGTVEAFERSFQDYLSDVCIFGCFRKTFVYFDVVDNSDSDWKLDGGKQESTDLASFSSCITLGPFRTSSASSLRPTAIFNHPFDFKCSSGVGCPRSPLPSLIFEVFDEDWFGRQILLGYGLVQVPSCPRTVVDVPLWIPKETQPFADRICGVYRPLATRVDIARQISRKQISTLARVGTLTVQLQITHSLGKLKPEPSKLPDVPAVQQSSLPVSAPPALSAEMAQQAPSLVKSGEARAVLQTPLLAPSAVLAPPVVRRSLTASRGPPSAADSAVSQVPTLALPTPQEGRPVRTWNRLPASLAPLSRIVQSAERDETPSFSEPAGTPGARTGPPDDERPAVLMYSASARRREGATEATDPEGQEMSSDAGFAAAVATISMSARARRRRPNA
jgi:hypothetical protein